MIILNAVSYKRHLSQRFSFRWRERLILSFFCFHCLVWLCRAAWIPVTEQTEEDQRKLFYNVETGQNVTQDDTGILVPLDNILDSVVVHPAGNKNHNVQPECAAGSSLLELDLCLSPAQAAMFDSQSVQYGGRRKREISRNGFSLWNNGVIPFVFNSTFSTADIDAILGAMSEWEKSTCIRFREAVAGDRDVVVFKDGIRCSTNIGRIGNEQIVTLSDKCRRKRILIHELGHVIGLIHEHQRHDRDSYVKVIFENVRNASQERYQFSKLLSESLTEGMVNYDYTSIMHYGRNYFAKSPELTTLQTTDSHYQDVIGRAEKPSLSDIETVNRLYHCVDPGIYRNNLLYSTCEFFARRGDCEGSMKDIIGHPCLQLCKLYQLQLNTHVLSVTSTQPPISTKIAQPKLVTPPWSIIPNLQPSGKLNSSSNHNTVFKIDQSRSSASSLSPVKTNTSARPHQKERGESSLRGQQHTSRSPVRRVTLPQRIRQNTSNLLPPRNVRKQLQVQITTSDNSLRGQQHTSRSPVRRVTLPQRIKQNTSNIPPPRNVRKQLQIQIMTSDNSLRGQQHTSRSPVRQVTFPRVIKQNTSNLLPPRNVRKQLQVQIMTHDNSLHQRRITSNSTNTRPKNQTRARVVTIKRQPVNRNSRRFPARNTTRMPPVHQLNQDKSSLRVPAYRIYRQSRLSNHQGEHHKAIMQPTLRPRQSTKDPYDINSFIEFIISRQLVIPPENAGTNGNSGRADMQTSNFAINCRSNTCGRNPWKGMNEYMPNKNLSITGETDQMNQRHLVLTDSTGPEFGLTVNHRPANVNDNIKTDSVLINDHGMQASLPRLIKYNIASESLASRNHGSSPRYPEESSISVPWGPSSQDLAESPSGQIVKHADHPVFQQSIDAFVANTEMYPSQ